MMLGQYVLDLGYFHYHYYYDHLLSIKKIYNPEFNCYVRPASIIINRNTALCLNWKTRQTKIFDMNVIVSHLKICATIFLTLGR